MKTYCFFRYLAPENLFSCQIEDQSIAVINRWLWYFPLSSSKSSDTIPIFLYFVESNSWSLVSNHSEKIIYHLAISGGSKAEFSFEFFQSHYFLEIFELLKVIYALRFFEKSVLNNFWFWVCCVRDSLCELLYLWFIILLHFVNFLFSLML